MDLRGELWAELRGVPDFPVGKVEVDDAILLTDPDFKRPGFEVEIDFLFDLSSGVGRREHLDADFGRFNEADQGPNFLPTVGGEPDNVGSFNPI